MIPFRDENPARKLAVVNLGLIMVNALVFFYMLTLNAADLDLFIYRYSVVPWEVINTRQLPTEALGQLLGTSGSLPSKNVWLSLLTCMFLHSGWMHIVFNMLFLFIFGNNVEEAMGHLPYLAFYLVCGLGASLLQCLVEPNSVSPILGASGAIAGVMGAYLILYPRARVLTLVFIFLVYVPAWAFIGVWIVYQIISALEDMSGMTGGVAWFAHIGGAATGMLITIVFYPLLRDRKSPVYRREQPYKDRYY